MKPMTPRTLDEVGVAPAGTDKCGRYWLRDGAAVAARIGGVPHAGVADWIVEAPWAHPLWHSYFVALVHLRPTPDVEPAKIYVPGATHEFWVYALNPAEAREPVIRGAAAPTVLTPVNFAAQLVCASDAAAMQLVEAAVADVIAGRLSPDTDFIRDWAARFGSAMLK